MTSVRIELPYPVDLVRTIGPLVRGRSDPTTRVAPGTVLRAVRTPDGPATVRLTQRGPSVVEAEATGPGGERALAEVAPGLVGADDDPAAFPAECPDRHPAVEDAWRRHHDVLLTRADPFPVLVAAVLEQKVTGVEAREAWRALVRWNAEPAPGDDGLLLPPDATRVAEVPSWVLARAGVVGRRASTLREIARHAARIARLPAAPIPEATTWLGALPGVGPWTIAEVARLALGDADAVSVGDFHLPHVVAWTLAGEPRATDARMLELLAPYAGHRGRVQRLLEATGATAPRFGPRVEPRAIV
ncbi:MAG TPA: DNA-3-methyladenine glycosylase 2 family protein [Actinomycetota bacterium]